MDHGYRDTSYVSFNFDIFNNLAWLLTKRCLGFDCQSLQTIANPTILNNTDYKRIVKHEVDKNSVEWLYTNDVIVRLWYGPEGLHSPMFPFSSIRS